MRNLKRSIQGVRLAAKTESAASGIAFKRDCTCADARPSGQLHPAMNEA
jgi:hypothetical protein